MADSSFLTELLHSLAHAVTSLTGWTQATHAEAQGARRAAERSERGQGGSSVADMFARFRTPLPNPISAPPISRPRMAPTLFDQMFGRGRRPGANAPFDVIEGRPAEAGNARSLTKMLAGGGGGHPPIMPRTATAAGGGGGDDNVGDQSINTIGYQLGRIIGNIFRRLSGHGAVVSGSGAALSAYGVASALNTFGQHQLEASRVLRPFNAQTNATFAHTEWAQQRQQHAMAEQTADSTQALGRQKEKTNWAWLRATAWGRNVMNTAGEYAMKPMEGLGHAATALVNPAKPTGLTDRLKEKAEEKKFDAMTERQQRNYLDEKASKANTTFGNIFNRFVAPGRREGLWKFNKHIDREQRVPPNPTNLRWHNPPPQGNFAPRVFHAEDEFAGGNKPARKGEKVDLHGVNQRAHKAESDRRRAEIPETHTAAYRARVHAAREHARELARDLKANADVPQLKQIGE